jgi:hypothetical protein
MIKIVGVSARCGLSDTKHARQNSSKITIRLHKINIIWNPRDNLTTKEGTHLNHPIYQVQQPN